MAIDDNTVYGLTGAQLKELPGKIEAAKGLAKVLTSADYNWPTNNPSGVALWKLDAGCYVPSNGISIYCSADSASNELNVLYLVGTSTGDRCPILKIKDTLSNSRLYNTGTASGAAFVYRPFAQVTNSLTSTATVDALSAAQGKALKDLIDALDTDLQSQIDAIVASSDVKDIVGTKAALNNYDTTTLGDNDIIKVLADESQSNATTYYRWSVSGAAFTLIGSEGPYYTKSQTDTLVNAKADASTTYTKSEVDTALNGKVDNATLSSYATTTAMNTALAGKADAPAAGTTYVTDAAMTTALATKADASTTYTKTEVDTALAGKAGTNVATTTNNGLMSAADKQSLDNVKYMFTGTGQSNNPYAVKVFQSDSAGDTRYSYLRTTGFSQVTGAYVGGIVYEPDASWNAEARLALYSDLPTVNDATLTIQKNGTTVNTFTANSSTNKTVNIEVPVITMTTTDPGEGSALAANNFIAVYSA